MKPLLIISLTLLTLTTYCQDTQLPMTLEYSSGVKLDSINRPGGQFVFIQLCTTLIDSIIKSGDITFAHSKVGRIKDCNYKYQIRQDTLEAIIIKTNKKKSTTQIIAQTTDQFGQPTKVTDNGTVTYTWIGVTTSGGQFTAVLTILNNHKNGILIVERNIDRYPKNRTDLK